MTHFNYKKLGQNIGKLLLKSIVTGFVVIATNVAYGDIGKRIAKKLGELQEKAGKQ